MANMSTYLENIVLNMVMRNTAYTRPTVVYVGLASTTATDLQMEAGTLTNEVTSYTGNRPAVTFNAPSQVGGKATITNSAALEFVNMPAVTVGYAFVADAATVGNILYWCPVSPTKTTNAGDTFRIPASGLTIDLD